MCSGFFWGFTSTPGGTSFGVLLNSYYKINFQAFLQKKTKLSITTKLYNAKEATETKFIDIFISYAHTCSEVHLKYENLFSTVCQTLKY